MFDLVKTLTEIPGPTGQEELIHEWCARHWSETHPAKLGGGPLIVHGDASAHYSHRLSMELIGVGESIQGEDAR